MLTDLGLKRLKCLFFGHNWIINYWGFASNKMICARCQKIAKFVNLTTREIE